MAAEAIVAVGGAPGAYGNDSNFRSMFLSQIFATTTVASVPGNIQPLALIGFAAIFFERTHYPVESVRAAARFDRIRSHRIRATGEHGPNALFGAALAFLSSLSAAGSKRHVQKAQASREFDSLNRLANGGRKSTTISAYHFYRNSP